MCDRETGNTIIESPVLYELKQKGSMLSKQLHSVFVKYLKEDRHRAPKETQLQDLLDSFQDGAKHDRKALQNKFKSWAKRMELREPDKALILSSTKKVILPIEEFEATIMAIHVSSETHLSVDRVVTEIKKSYTWSRRDFGMDWEIVTKVISRRCNKAMCLQKLQHRFPRRPICVFAPKEDEADDFMKSGVSQQRLPCIAPNLTPESASCRPANANTFEAERAECQQPCFVVNPIFKAPESFSSFLTPNVHSKIFGKEAETTTTTTCGVQLPVSFLSQRLFNAYSAHRNLVGIDCAPRGVTSGSFTPVPPILPLRAINQQLAGRVAGDYCDRFHHPTEERLKSPTENQNRKGFSSSESVAVDNLTSPEKLGDATLRSQNRLQEEKMREYLSALLPFNATLGNSITCGSQTPGTFTYVITPIEYQKHRNQTTEHLVGGERASNLSESKTSLPVAGGKSKSEIGKQPACSESTRPPNFTSMHKFDIRFVGDRKGSAKPKATISLSQKPPTDAKELSSRPTAKCSHARKLKESKKRLIGQEKKDFIKGGEVSKDRKVLKVGDGSVTLTAVSGDEKKTSVKSSSKLGKKENSKKIGDGSVTLTQIHRNDANVEKSKTDIKSDGIKDLRRKSRRKSTPYRRKNVEDKTVKSIYSNFFQKAVIKASSSTSKTSSSSSKLQTLPSPHRTRLSQKRSAAVAFQNDASASNIAFQNDASAFNVAFQKDASAAAAAKDVSRHSKQANKKTVEPKVSETSLSSPISLAIKNDLITQLANVINNLPQTVSSLKANASGLGSTQIITNKGMKMTSICNVNERQVKLILPPVNVSGNRTLSTSTAVSEKGANQVTLPPSTLFIIRPMQQPNKTVYGPNQFADSKPRVSIPQQLQKIAMKAPANSVGCNTTKSNSVNSSLGNEKMPNNRNNKSEKIKLCKMREKKDSKNKQSEAVNKKAERVISTAKSQHSERPTHLVSSDDIFGSFVHKIHAMKKNLLPAVANMGRGKYADTLKSQIDRCYRMVKEMKMDHDFSEYEED